MERSSFGVPHYKGNIDLKAMLYGDINPNNDRYSVADICFICDITGTMNHHVKVIRSILVDFVNSIKNMIDSQPRIAFIGFRDKKDEVRIERKEFTSNPKEMVEFISKVKCTGGGDVCEDLVRPLEEALTLDWRSDLNYVYLLVDAPTHGSIYHKPEVTDDFPEDYKSQMLEKLAAHYRKARINLVLLRCNESVDIMIESIKKYYESPINKLCVLNVCKKDVIKEDFANNFLVSITNNMADSLIVSRYKNFKKVNIKSYEAAPVDKEIDMGFTKEFVGILHTGVIKGISFEAKKYDYTLKLETSSEFKCIISTSKIGAGTFADCYPLYVGEQKDYVAKLPKVPAFKAEDLMSDIENTLFAKLFADKFNHYLKKAGDKESKEKGGSFLLKTVKVIPLVIIENRSPEKFTGAKVFFAQILLEGEYMKFNNNYGWKRNDKDSITLIANAYSHFTYEFSMGTMIVVDIQGIVNEKEELMITDPAIHSYLHAERFGETNHGRVGMLRFFKTHECNDYCKRLGLTNSKEIGKDKADEIKKKYKEDKGLRHLYEEFELKVGAWKEKISGFDPKAEPVEANVEEERSADEERTRVEEKVRVKFSGKS